MSAPYRQAPKKLVRSRSNKMVGGVCGGVADFLNMDPTLVRVLTAVLTIFTGVPLVVYIVMLIVVPEENSAPSYPAMPPSPSTAPGFGSPYETPAPTYAPHAAAGAGRSDDAVWGTEGAPWEQRASTPPAAPTPTAPSDPPPVEPADPEPVAPSDPEAPVVTPPDTPVDEDRPKTV